MDAYLPDPLTGLQEFEPMLGETPPMPFTRHCSLAVDRTESSEPAPDDVQAKVLTALTETGFPEQD